MNDTAIENILLHAPKPAAPADLLKRLQAEIALPAGKPAAKPAEWRSPLRRWFPALAFGVFMLSCAIMIAVQANWGGNLKRENETLRATAATLPKLREQHVAFERAQAEHDELVQLRKDNEEMQQLQAEAAQLRQLPGEIERLQNENQRLAAVPATSTNTTIDTSFFDEAVTQFERIECVNNLKQLGLAARIWAGDNDGKYSTSLVAMSNELSRVEILICPSDKARQNYTSLSFSQFQDNMTSYQYLAQPDDETYPECVIAYCPIHHNYLLADGSVQQFNLGTYREVKKDGRLYVEFLKPPGTTQPFGQ